MLALQEDQFFGDFIMKRLYMGVYLGLMAISAMDAQATKTSTSGGNKQSTQSNQSANNNNAKDNGTKTNQSSNQSMADLMKVGKLKQSDVDALRELLAKQSVDQLKSFQKDNMKFRDDDQKKIDNEKDQSKKALLQKDQAKVKVYLMIVDDLLKKANGGGAQANSSANTPAKNPTNSPSNASTNSSAKPTSTSGKK